MKRIVYILILLLILLGYWSCIEEIEFDISGNQPSIVVNGLISSELQEYTIKINESSVLGLGTDNITEPISGATVRVVEAGGTDIQFIEDIDEPGSYRATMQGQVGSTYHVEIDLASGENIVSNPTTILAPIDIDSIFIRVDEESGLNASGNSEVIANVVSGVSATIPSTGPRPFLRYRVLGEYEFQELAPGLLFPRRCFIKDFLDFNNLALINTNDISGNQIPNTDVVRTTLNQRFNVIYGFGITQYRISEQEFTYWSQVDKLINIDGTLFDPPPANIIGNLQNTTNPDVQIQGYFSVVSESFDRQFVETGRLGHFVQTKCTGFTFRENPPDCADCTIISNSSLDKPSYWPI